MLYAQEDLTQLLVRVADRDREAFSEFYDRLSPLIYTIALRMLRVKPEAEDLVQEIFLQAWNQADSYDRSRGKPEAWMITITKSRAIDKIRSRRRKEQGAPAFEDLARRTAFEAEARASETGAKLTLETALSDLSEIQRIALEMAYLEGKTQNEIAAELGVPVGTIKTRIRDGLMKLRRKFGGGAES